MDAGNPEKETKKRKAMTVLGSLPFGRSLSFFLQTSSLMLWKSETTSFDHRVLNQAKQKQLQLQT